MAEEEEVPYTVTYLDGEAEEVTWIKRAGKARVQYKNGLVCTYVVLSGYQV
mgnify:CR=1 FL=1